MKMSEVAVDSGRSEAGAWVGDVPDMPGLRLKVRGSNNKDWRKLTSKLLEAVPRKRRLGNRLDPEDTDHITNMCLLNTSLLDWEGLEDDDGKEIPYSRDVAHKLCTDPDFRRFRDAVAWAANLVGEQNEEDVKDASGNLVKFSVGTTDGERKSKTG